MASLDTTPAEPAERAAAFRLIFQHLSNDEIALKHAAAETMIAHGEMDPQSIWLARDGTGPAAAMIAAPLPGGGAIVWPPRVRPSLDQPGQALAAVVHHALNWLQWRGVKLAQATLPIAETDAIGPLLEVGFVRMTRLVYLRHFLDLSFSEIATPERCHFEAYSGDHRQSFEDVLGESYIGTLDCPELNDHRTVADVLAAYRGSHFNPETWWLASDRNQPVGVLLVNKTDEDTWDIGYVGIAARFRSQGFGRDLIRKALFEAKAAGILTVTLAVDERNHPALNLYRRCGFEPFDEREVYLKVLSR